MLKRVIAVVCAFTLLGCTPKVNKTPVTSDLPSDNNEKYTLIWSEEFEGDKLDESVWNLEEGYIANNELQDYKKTGNHTVSDGTLKIVAKKMNENKEFGSYTSARMTTYGKKSFTYGRIEARMKLPQGVGTWPAFWMLGNSIAEGGSWPNCGEIDIMEHVGFDPNVVHGSLHSTANNHSIGTQLSGKTTISSVEEWNIYGVLWDEKFIRFYIDNPENVFYTATAPTVKTTDNWPFDKPHFILLNLAIGGMWGGQKGVDNTIFDVTMEIDYVRVYTIN